MARKYNMGKKSDVKRFERQVEKDLKKQTNRQLKKGVSSICPNCGKEIKISTGKNKCKYCGADINFEGKV